MYLSDIKRDDRFEGYLIVRSAEQRALGEKVSASISGDTKFRKYDDFDFLPVGFLQ